MVISYSAVVWSSGYSGNFWDYYGNGWATVTPIGTLLWAGISETTNPKDAGTFIKGLVNAVVKELQKEDRSETPRGRREDVFS